MKLILCYKLTKIDSPANFRKSMFNSTLLVILDNDAKSYASLAMWQGCVSRILGSSPETPDTSVGISDGVCAPILAILVAIGARTLDTSPLVGQDHVAKYIIRRYGNDDCLLFFFY